MAISSAQITAYANYYLPQFQFADTEQIFPLKVDSWLQQCAQGDWKSAGDPHRGTAAVTAKVPLSLVGLDALVGCNGASGAPIDPSKTLPFNTPDSGESFVDFAGWTSLVTGNGFVAGDDGYIRSYLSPYFAQFNNALGGPSPVNTLGGPPLARTTETLPTTMSVYCEAAWAGAFTRLDIQNNTMDFAPASTTGSPQPDLELDPYFVLTYYLFYPATEPPPNIGGMLVTSPNLLKREGQWEAVSFYFKQSPNALLLNPPNDLEIPSDPSQTTPAFVMLSAGITLSGDGQSPGLAIDYPASSYTPPPPGPNPTVWVTSGTHKNLSSSTSVTTWETGQSPSNSGWAAAGAGLEGVGGIVAGITGATGVGLVIGFLLWLIGLLISVVDTTGPVPVLVTTTDAPDSSGDVANSGGAVSGSVPAATATSYVKAELVVISTLPNTPELPPPAWWSYPGRWGIAVSSDSSGWNSGGRRIDFIGRSRAYWNTVWAQHSL